MQAIRSYLDKEKGRPPTDPTNYLNLKAASEEWYDNNDNRNEEVEVEVEEGNAEDNNDNVFNDGMKLIYNQSGKYPYNKYEYVYDGTTMTMIGFCRYLLAMKTNIAVGDVAFCIVASSIISFLPSPNMFEVCFDGKSPTRYKIASVINYFADLSDHLSTYKFDVCDNGSCILKKDIDSRCVHTVTKRSSFYYMSMRERLVFLLNSDLKNMFLYPFYKYRSPKV